jgi:nucleoside-diphosphate-sugar epimerase
VVSGILLAAARDEALGELFNIGDVANHELGELQRILARVMGARARIPLWLPVSLAYGAAAGGGAIARVQGGRPALNLDRIRLFTARNWTMDVGKAQRMLGYAPSFDLASGLADTVRWCREMGWLD